jgi:hypothetical protein
MSRSEERSSPHRAPLLLPSLVVLALCAAGCGSLAKPSDHPLAAPTTTVPARMPIAPHLPTSRHRSATLARGVSVVAQAIVPRVAVYHTPESPTPFVRLPNPSSIGTALVFLIRRSTPGWEQVYLPIRPDGSTGWVKDRDVRVALDPYSLQVRLASHELVLRKQNRVVEQIRAGVGRSVLPTPRGRYYIIALLKQPDPAGPYGPYAFGLSAYSHVLMSFGGGPGEIGIHGTNNPSSIGRNVSHGCIRIPNTAVTRLAALLPLGTPVTIEDA